MYRGSEKDFHLVGLSQMANSSTRVGGGSRKLLWLFLRDCGGLFCFFQLVQLVRERRSGGISWVYWIVELD